jgi:biotin transporter BioY
MSGIFMPVSLVCCLACLFLHAWRIVSALPSCSTPLAALMHIVAIGWLYVTLMMAISEDSVVAGVLTFLLYGILPVAIILYISGSKQRKKKQEAARLQALQASKKDESGAG